MPLLQSSLRRRSAIVSDTNQNGLDELAVIMTVTAASKREIRHKINAIGRAAAVGIETASTGEDSGVKIGRGVGTSWCGPFSPDAPSAVTEGFGLHLHGVGDHGSVVGGSPSNKGRSGAIGVDIPGVLSSALLNADAAFAVDVEDGSNDGLTIDSLWAGAG